jgi:murein L,D-transpeptidase YcbB/YkuD
MAEKTLARSGWLVGLVALAGGFAAPVAAPVMAPPAASKPPVAVAHIDMMGGVVGVMLAASLAQPGADPELAGFYAARDDRPLWSEDGRLKPEAEQLIALVEDAAADGLRPADYNPDGLRAAVQAAASGRPDELATADMALSEALGAWGADLHRPNPLAPTTYSDPGFRSPAVSRWAVLDIAARTPSLKAGLAEVRRMNPIYEGLRAALAAEKARGGPNVAVIRANLERARGLPADLGRRYILVDVAAQRLWAYENGRVVDGMKVVVGKPSDPTPTMAALVRYAVFRPYWNVPPDLVAASIAPKVLKQGLGSFHAKHLEALSDWTDRAVPVDPAKVNWRAVAAGRRDLRVRQLPGPDNMMGEVKFMFPNQYGVYLHDSPLRAFFNGDVRLASAGCVRLEDASRLARWLLGDAAVVEGKLPGPPETRVDLREPVPVYILYLTAAPAPEGVSLRKDFYRRDAALIARIDKPAAGVQLASAGPAASGVGDRGRDLIKGAGQVGAERVQHRHKHHRDQPDDQAVLNRGGSGPVLSHASEKLRHRPHGRVLSKHGQLQTATLQSPEVPPIP